MNKLPTNITSFQFVTSANTVAFIIANLDFSNDELYAFSQWFMQVGQYLSTYVSYNNYTYNKKKKDE